MEPKLYESMAWQFHDILLVHASYPIIADLFEREIRRKQ
jgi:hypothetical protein